MPGMLGKVWKRPEGKNGSVLLTRFPILQTDHVDLNVCGREPRMASDHLPLKASIALR